MAFCMNCGKELPEGTKFCSECGARVAVNGVMASNNDKQTQVNIQQNTQMQQSIDDNMIYTQNQISDDKQVSTLDKYGKFFGIILFVLALLVFNSDPPIITIALSVAIIVGAFFSLSKKYKLKGFTIIALIIAIFCLVAGVGQAKEYGLFYTPSDDEYSYSVNRNVGTSKKETSEETKVIPGEETTLAEDILTDEPNAADSIENKTETTDTAQEMAKTDGVDPEVKDFLDSYEEFVDEYVEFMKKYQSDSSNTISMLGEYSEMMQKYADFAEKIDKYDSTNMSAADYKYYIEVTTRCTQKMLEVY